MEDKYLWVAVTDDEYRLPLAVAGDADELGELLGVKGKSIRESLSRSKRLGRNCIYEKVYMGDYDESKDT